MNAGLADAAPALFLATVDATRSRAFLEGILGLRFVADDGFALVFDLAGTPLRVQRVKALTPQPFTVLGWQVEDITAAVDALAARGVAFERYPGIEQDELGVWRMPEVSVAWFKDPDGNTLSLAQPAG